MEIESFWQGWHKTSKSLIFIVVPQAEQVPKVQKKAKRDAIRI